MVTFVNNDTNPLAEAKLRAKVEEREQDVHARLTAAGFRRSTRSAAARIIDSRTLDERAGEASFLAALVDERGGAEQRLAAHLAEAEKGWPGRKRCAGCGLPEGASSKEHEDRIAHIDEVFERLGWKRAA